MDICNFKDQELEISFKKVVAQERKIMHVVILHIQELERRKLYLARGFSSLFEYLTVKLNYSRAAAQRRIEAARLGTVVPSVLGRIESGELNLSQIGEIQKSVKLAERVHQTKVSAVVKSELVEKVLNQSTPNTQQICSEILHIPIAQTERVSVQKDKSKRIEITLTEKQYEKFSKLRDRFAHKNFQLKRTQEMADVLETIFDELLRSDGAFEVGDLSKDAASLDATKTVIDHDGHRKAEENVVSSSAAEVEWKSLTPKRKKIILERDRACQFKDHLTGHVCGSTFNLEVDHLQPKWDGGGNDPENLRILCRQHNQFRYQH